MNHVALFVLGAPGVGKTTLIRNLVPGLAVGSAERTEIESPKWTVIEGKAAVAGHWRGTAFDGGDTVPYTGARAALEYWHDKLRPMHLFGVTIFDGDRFSTQPSLDFIRSTGVDVFGVYLDAPDEYLDARRAARGSNQNPTWMRGRVTKAKNFAKKIDHVVIDATASPDEIARCVATVIRVRSETEKAA